MLILSSATISNSKTISFVNKKAAQMLSTPATAIPEAITIDSISPAKTDAAEIKKTAVVITAPEIEAAPKTSEAIPEGDNQIFTAVEVVPEFPGGISEFGKFLSKNVRYPQSARDQNLQGRVIASFIVEKDGSLTDLHIVRGVAPALDNEALRVLAMSPKWKPGIQNGRLARVAYSVPIAFTLSDNDSEQPANAKPAQNNVLADTSKKVSIPGQLNATNPIWVVDGKQLDYTPVINPDDIDNIVVLKSKSAEALYGEKASTRGVIVVTTKNNLLKKALKTTPKENKQ